jgi:hypothetical protein
MANPKAMQQGVPAVPAPQGKPMVKTLELKLITGTQDYGFSDTNNTLAGKHILAVSLAGAALQPKTRNGNDNGATAAIVGQAFLTLTSESREIVVDGHPLGLLRQDEGTASSREPYLYPNCKLAFADCKVKFNDASGLTGKSLLFIFHYLG